MEQIDQDRRSLFGFTSGEGALVAMGAIAASTVIPLNEGRSAGGEFD